MRRNKTKLVALLLTLVLLISIGYATISTNLTIGGNATITAQNWLIYFTNIQPTTGSVTPTTAPTTSGTTTTTLTWVVSLDTPGQFYEYTVDVKNDGSIDAMIGTLSNSTLTTDQAKYLDYTVTYSDGATIEQYDKLEAGHTETLRVRVEFKVDPEELPSSASAVTLNYASNYVQADETHAKARNTVTPPVTLEIGDSVAYTTTLNGQTLNDWKVFYVDGDYTYIILNDYLPIAAISNSIRTTYNLNVGEEDSFELSADESREDLIGAMATKENWDGLLTGTINGHTVNETRTTNVWAMGSPTLDLLVNSWNAKYPSDSLYTRYINTGDIDNNHFHAIGYAIGNLENPTTTEINLSGKTGFNNTLYFLDPGDYYTGYWLASPSTEDEIYVMSVWMNGYITYSYYGDFEYCKGFRPVICLPSSVINQ